MNIKPSKDWIRDTRITLNYTRSGTDFIKTHKLWKGFGQYKWLLKIGVVILAILVFDVVSSVPDILNNSNPAQAALNSSFNSLGSLEEYLGGGMKYLLLIAIEIVIFHFTRRSLMAVTGDHIPTDFDTFIKAEKRMIKVAIFSYIMETVYRMLSNTVLSMIGFEIAQDVMLFLIQSFYLGFALVDNYNELFHMTLKQSHRFTWHYAPVAIITGGIVNVLALIPGIGMVIGTVICSVIVTLSMHELTKNSENIQWVFVKKEKKKK